MASALGLYVDAMSGAAGRGEEQTMPAGPLSPPWDISTWRWITRKGETERPFEGVVSGRGRVLQYVRGVDESTVMNVTISGRRKVGGGFACMLCYR